jgi:hypothetical protein
MTKQRVGILGDYKLETATTATSVYEHKPLQVTLAECKVCNLQWVIPFRSYQALQCPYCALDEQLNKASIAVREANKILLGVNVNPICDICGRTKDSCEKNFKAHGVHK